MCRKNVCEKTPPVCCADSPLWDGAFGITAQFPAQAQSLRACQRLPLRGSWQNRQVLTEGVARAPGSPSVCSLRSQPAPPRGRLCAATTKFPATTKAVPLGKVASPQAMTEGVQPTRDFPAVPPLPQEAGAAAAVCRYAPSREKRVSEKSADFSETPNLK